VDTGGIFETSSVFDARTGSGNESETLHSEPVGRLEIDDDDDDDEEFYDAVNGDDDSELKASPPAGPSPRSTFPAAGRDEVAPAEATDDDEFHDAENGGYDVVAEVDDGSFPDGNEDDNSVNDYNLNADRSPALPDAPNGNSGIEGTDGEGGQCDDGSSGLDNLRTSPVSHAAPLHGEERYESGGVGKMLPDDHVEVEVEGGSGPATGFVDVRLVLEQRRASSPVTTAPTAGASTTSSDDLEEAPESFTLWTGECCRTCAKPFDTDVAIQHAEYTSMREQHRLPISCLACGQVECYSCVVEKFADMWDRNGSTDITHLPCTFCGVVYGHFADNEPVKTNPEQFGLPGPIRLSGACRPTKLLVCQPLIAAMIKLLELNEVIKILYELLTGKPLTAGPDGIIYYPKAAALEGSPVGEARNGEPVVSLRSGPRKNATLVSSHSIRTFWCETRRTRT
jgi:hypothetical protein